MTDIFDFDDDAIQLRVRADQRIDMFDRRHALILRGGRPRGGDQRFTGRVGNEMEMEITASQIVALRSRQSHAQRSL